jgi:hypothetical protein
LLFLRHTKFHTFNYFHLSHIIITTMLRSGLSKTVAREAARINKSSTHNGALRFMSGKVIKFGVDGRTAMLRGVETLADAVQVGVIRFLVEPITTTFLLVTHPLSQTAGHSWTQGP